MVFNFVVGLGIPWIFAILLYKRDKMLVLLIMPLASVISHTINGFGVSLRLWSVKPLKWHSFSELPYDLGLFALLGTLLIYTIKRTKKSPYIIIIGFTLGTTILEYIFVLFDKIVYYNWWNIFFTYFSYLISYLATYWYYLSIRSYVKGWENK